MEPSPFALGIKRCQIRCRFELASLSLLSSFILDESSSSSHDSFLITCYFLILGLLYLTDAAIVKRVEFLFSLVVLLGVD